MTDPTRPFRPCRAYELAAGALLELPGDGGPVLAMKVERQGKDFVNHYALPLDPRPGGGLTLIYLDPDQEIGDAGRAAAVDLGKADAAAGSAAAGDAFTTPKGTFFKVLQPPISRHKKHLAYVEVTTGIMVLRREQGVSAVYSGWRLADA